MTTPQMVRWSFALSALAWSLLYAALAHAEPVERPPTRFQDPASVTVSFMEPTQIGAYCREWGLDSVWLDAIRGCYLPALNVIVMPLPCEADGDYAALMCHEVGHAKGWSARHER